MVFAEGVGGPQCAVQPALALLHWVEQAGRHLWAAQPVLGRAPPLLEKQAMKPLRAVQLALSLVPLLPQVWVTAGPHAVPAVPAVRRQAHQADVPL